MGQVALDDDVPNLGAAEEDDVPREQLLPLSPQVFRLLAAGGLDELHLLREPSQGGIPLLALVHTASDLQDVGWGVGLEDGRVDLKMRNNRHFGDTQSGHAAMRSGDNPTNRRVIWYPEIFFFQCIGGQTDAVDGVL